MKFGFQNNLSIKFHQEQFKEQEPMHVYDFDDDFTNTNPVYNKY